jgi:3-dehydroquinate synthetase
VNNHWDEIIKRAIGVKARVIQEDPFERGIRQSLNLGHTVGHGIERASQYDLLHGEAVAIGIVIEAKMAEALGVANKGLSDEVAQVLQAVGLPVEIPENIDRESAARYMKFDKKKSKGKVKFALPTGIGGVDVGIEVDDYARFLV